MTFDYAEDTEGLLALKAAIVDNFTAENWLEIGAITGTVGLIQNHPRLLRSLRFGDSDYGGATLDVLAQMTMQDDRNFKRIEAYVQKQFDIDDGEMISSTQSSQRKIVFAPRVFEIPEASADPCLVAVMMPFSAEFSAAYVAIKDACIAVGLKCQRADDLWQHETIIQDVFSLIFRSFIVVSDFSQRNANVFYETGIAHTLGKHVVPISQAASDVPFDLRHHRYIPYLNNNEGLQALQTKLVSRLCTLTDKSPPVRMVGTRVSHHKFGDGTVIDVAGQKITVNFDKIGLKRVIDTFLQPEDVYR